MTAFDPSSYTLKHSGEFYTAEEFQGLLSQTLPGLDTARLRVLVDHLDRRDSNGAPDGRLYVSSSLLFRDVKALVKASGWSADQDERAQAVYAHLHDYRLPAYTLDTSQVMTRLRHVLSEDLQYRSLSVDGLLTGLVQMVAEQDRLSNRVSARHSGVGLDLQFARLIQSHYPNLNFRIVQWLAKALETTLSPQRSPEIWKVTPYFESDSDDKPWREISLDSASVTLNQLSPMSFSTPIGTIQTERIESESVTIQIAVDDHPQWKLIDQGYLTLNVPLPLEVPLLSFDPPLPIAGFSDLRGIVLRDGDFELRLYGLPAITITETIRKRLPVLFEDNGRGALRDRVGLWEISDFLREIDEWTPWEDRPLDMPFTNIMDESIAGHVRLEGLDARLSLDRETTAVLSGAYGFDFSVDLVQSIIHYLRVPLDQIRLESKPEHGRSHTLVTQPDAQLKIEEWALTSSSPELTLGDLSTRWSGSCLDRKQYCATLEGSLTLDEKPFFSGSIGFNNGRLHQGFFQRITGDASNEFCKIETNVYLGALSALTGNQVSVSRNPVLSASWYINRAVAMTPDALRWVEAESLLGRFKQSGTTPIQAPMIEMPLPDLPDDLISVIPNQLDPDSELLSAVRSIRSSSRPELLHPDLDPYWTGRSLFLDSERTEYVSDDRDDHLPSPIRDMLRAMTLDDPQERLTLTHFDGFVRAQIAGGQIANFEDQLRPDFWQGMSEAIVLGAEFRNRILIHLAEMPSIMQKYPELDQAATQDAFFARVFSELEQREKTEENMWAVRGESAFLEDVTARIAASEPFNPNRRRIYDRVFARLVPEYQAQFKPLLEKYPFLIGFRWADPWQLRSNPDEMVDSVLMVYRDPKYPGKPGVPAMQTISFDTVEERASGDPKIKLTADYSGIHERQDGQPGAFIVAYYPGKKAPLKDPFWASGKITGWTLSPHGLTPGKIISTFDPESNILTKALSSTSLVYEINRGDGALGSRMNTLLDLTGFALETVGARTMPDGSSFNERFGVPVGQYPTTPRDLLVSFIAYRDLWSANTELKGAGFFKLDDTFQMRVALAKIDHGRYVTHLPKIGPNGEDLPVGLRFNAPATLSDFLTTPNRAEFRFGQLVVDDLTIEFAGTLMQVKKAELSFERTADGTMRAQIKHCESVHIQNGTAHFVAKNASFELIATSGQDPAQPIDVTLKNVACDRLTLSNKVKTATGEVDRAKSVVIPIEPTAANKHARPHIDSLQFVSTPAVADRLATQAILVSGCSIPIHGIKLGVQLDAAPTFPSSTIEVASGEVATLKLDGHSWSITSDRGLSVKAEGELRFRDLKFVEALYARAKTSKGSWKSDAQFEQTLWEMHRKDFEGMSADVAAHVGLVAYVQNMTFKNDAERTLRGVLVQGGPVDFTFSGDAMAAVDLPFFNTVFLDALNLRSPTSRHRPASLHLDTIGTSLNRRGEVETLKITGLRLKANSDGVLSQDGNWLDLSIPSLLYRPKPKTGQSRLTIDVSHGGLGVKDPFRDYEISADILTTQPTKKKRKK